MAKHYGTGVCRIEGGGTEGFAAARQPLRKCLPLSATVTPDFDMLDRYRLADIRFGPHKTAATASRVTKRA